jgi:hypothetical protein
MKKSVQEHTKICTKNGKWYIFCFYPIPVSIVAVDSLQEQQLPVHGMAELPHVNRRHRQVESMVKYPRAEMEITKNKITVGYPIDFL